ncbi:MAG: hypothetical protein K6G03_08200 [Lachnospiraceae bacterium]|nr:hypothetical protein [Lachnospiraceae bacterium]
MIKKRSFIILMALSAVMILYSLTLFEDTEPYTGFMVTKKISENFSYVDLFFSVFLLISVYGDEFKSLSFITVIGRGISRCKFVLAKFSVTVIITAIVFAVLFILSVLLWKTTGLSLTPDQFKFMILSFMTAMLDVIAMVTLSAIIMYLTGNLPLCLFFYFTINLILPVIIYYIEPFTVIGRFHILRYFFSGFCSNAVAYIMFGAPLQGLGTLLAGILLYIGLSLAVILAIFNKKELDF